MQFSTTEFTEHTEKESNGLTGKIIGAAIEIHRALGPGLLESAYETCFIYELRLRKLKVENQKSMPVFYKDVMLDCGYRADLVIEDQVYREGFKNQEMPRRRPDFEPSVAGAEAAKLKKFSDAGGFKSQDAHAAKNRFLRLFRYSPFKGRSYAEGDH